VGSAAAATWGIHSLTHDCALEGTTWTEFFSGREAAHPKALACRTAVEALTPDLSALSL